MKHEHHPFENQIFNHFRTEEIKIHESIHKLVQYNYKVIDLQNQVIDKTNIDDLDKRTSFDYKRTPKRPYEKTH